MGELVAYEAGFRRAGLPLFIEDYSAARDIFNRAVPLFALVVVLETVGVARSRWSLPVNIAAVIGGLAILLVVVGIANRVKGRRFLALPAKVGVVELALFVLVPAILPLIFGQQEGTAAIVLAVNLALVGLVYLTVGFGLPSIVRWSAVRVVTSLAQSLLLLTKAVPLLLIFAIVLFVNTEMWQVFSSVSDAGLIAIAALFVTVGTLFLIARLPREVTVLERQAGGDGPPLRRRQRVNVALVMFVSQALQILVVSAAVGAFFAVLGTIAIGPDVRESWIGSEGDVLLDVSLFGEPLQVTRELLRVCSGMAAISGLYYAIATLTDVTYRAEFLEGLTAEMRATFESRARYLALRAAPGPAQA